MDMRIWKYRLEVTDRQAVEMPAGAVVLSADLQNGDIQVWALVDADSKTEKRWFTIVGTGNPILKTLGEFVGTVLMPPFVWHVFVDVN